MKNNYVFELENGPKLVFYQDTSKHSVSASVIVRYGGIHSDFEMNGTLYHMEDGMAHFLEHLLIEHSVYGNALTNFHNHYVSMNGYTTSKLTRFDINTVHDFEENLVKLIKLVNTPAFTKEDIEETKPAIIEEICKYKDSKFRCLDVIDKKCLFQNIKFLTVSGKEEYIQNLGYDDIKLCYDIFYQPNNQVIAICGNFDVEKVKKVIEETYQEISKNKIEYKVPDFLEPLEVCKKEDTLLYDVHQNYTQINYKVNIKKLNGYQRVKLSFYLDYFLRYNFGSSSDIYKYMVQNKIASNDIDVSVYFIDEFVIIKIGVYTDKSDEFVQLVQEKIKEMPFNEEDFELRKKKSIISLILREEYPKNMLEPFVDNIITFNYEDIDKIEDIEAQTLEDYINTISSLKFINYCITHMVPKE